MLTPNIVSLPFVEFVVNDRNARARGQEFNGLADDVTIRGKKISRKERCCSLGKDVAKIGIKCTYTENIDNIYPNSHYHQMKSSIWMTVKRQPINERLLQKCKPYKVFYEKCCLLEYSLIEEDLRRKRKKLTQYLRQIRKNVVDDGEEVERSDNTEGRTVSSEKQYF